MKEGESVTVKLVDFISKIFKFNVSCNAWLSRKENDKFELMMVFRISSWRWAVILLEIGWKDFLTDSWFEFFGFEGIEIVSVCGYFWDELLDWFDESGGSDSWVALISSTLFKTSWIYLLLSSGEIFLHVSLMWVDRKVGLAWGNICWQCIHLASLCLESSHQTWEDIKKSFHHMLSNRVGFWQPSSEEFDVAYSIFGILIFEILINRLFSMD